MGVAAETGTRSGPRLGPSISELSAAFRSGEATPADVCRQVLAEIAERGADGVWISVADEEAVLARCAALAEIDDPSALPLWGIPFGVKDSIDIAGWPTTLACPEYAYVATETAPVVAAAARRRRRADRQDQPRPVRHRAERHPDPVPDAPQRVRTGPDLRRIELGLGARGGARRGPLHRGHRHGRLRPRAAGAQRHPRLQAVPRTHQRRRTGAGLPVPGLHQPDRRHRRRPGDGAGRGRGRRRRRSLEPGAGPPRRDGSRSRDRAARARRPGVLRRRPRWRGPPGGPGPAERAPGHPVRSPWTPSSTPASCSTRVRGWPSGYVEFGDFLREHPDGGAARRRRHHQRRGRGSTPTDVFRAQYRLAELKAVVGRLFDRRRRRRAADDRHHLHDRGGAGGRRSRPTPPSATTPTAATCSTCAPPPCPPA